MKKKLLVYYVVYGGNMKDKNKKEVVSNQLSEKITTIVKVFLLLYGAFFFFFALFSGASDYGGGIEGLIYNFPNTLPWILLFVIIYIAWRWEFLGGVILFFLGLASIFFFNIYESKSWITFLIMSFPFLVSGIMLMFVSSLATFSFRKNE